MPRIEDDVTLEEYWTSADGSVRFFCGDAGKILRELPARSVQCAVTSPPYWGLRKYGDAPEELGREATPAEYVARLVRLFGDLRRVLRDDGTLWLNIGDTWQGRKDGGTAGLPWRVALAMEEDGWVLRQDLVWHKTTAMPDGSATNRFTRAHEYLFLLVKGKGYHLDGEAVRNPPREGEIQGSWRRSVWSLPNPGYPGAHYATFPEALVRPCVLAGTSAAGCCAACDTPLRRVTRRRGGKLVAEESRADRDRSYGWSRNGIDGGLDGERAVVETVGWEKGCRCETRRTRPCLVLDPFAGSGTTAAVAFREKRRCWGIELNADYLDRDAVPRIRKMEES